MLSPARRLLKFFHPEGIPLPGTIAYNAISKTRVFQVNYEIIARDIIYYCPEGSILDIGTGPGWLLEKLHSASPNLQLTGIDISPSMIKKAKKNLAKSGLSDCIEIALGNASDILCSDNYFDAVVSTGSIHHWKAPTEGLNEIHRVLKPDGYALIYDLLSDTPLPVLKKSAREFGRFRMLMLWLHAYEEPFYSLKDFEHLADNTFFKKGSTKFVSVLCCLVLRKE
ncbi:MAG: class I SAM-dependent methyltransferase [Candidatus Latescibacteria bacterium]|nr:class I SAM-dependent methyltransferase [Candidatus Latescibacterota bacterium]